MDNGYPHYWGSEAAAGRAGWLPGQDLWAGVGREQPDHRLGSSSLPGKATHQGLLCPPAHLTALQRAESPSVSKRKCYSSFSPAAVDVLKLRKHLDD